MLSTPPSQVNFQYVFSQNHRTYQADGMYGGNNSQNKLVISFYTERPTKPLSAVLKLKDGLPAGPEEIVTENSFVREFELSVAMDLNIAISFYVWLEDKLINMSAAVGTSSEQLKDVVKQYRGDRDGI